jgi:hypothetical protein
MNAQLARITADEKQRRRLWRFYLTSTPIYKVTQKIMLDCATVERAFKTFDQEIEAEAAKALKTPLEYVVYELMKEKRRIDQRCQRLDRMLNNKAYALRYIDISRALRDEGKYRTFILLQILAAARKDDKGSTPPQATPLMNLFAEAMQQSGDGDLGLTLETRLSLQKAVGDGNSIPAIGGLIDASARDAE